MENIFDKLGKWFKPNTEKEFKVIGFYTNANELFLYNSWDDTFDNFLKVDLIVNGFKYENNSMLHLNLIGRNVSIFGITEIKSSAVQPQLNTLISHQMVFHVSQLLNNIIESHGNE